MPTHRASVDIGEFMAGKFIVFEGIDGAGKTTQVNLLARKIESIGGKVKLTAEPTELPTGKELRRVLAGEIKKSDCEIATMFMLDRIAHNIDKENGINAMLDAGYTVICDRYYYSSLAYQGSSTDYDWVKSINLDCPEIRRPDLCIFLDLTPEQSLERIKKGRDTLEIFENAETLTRVRNCFFSVLTDLDDNIAVLDAYRTPDEIAEDIFTIYKSL